MDNWGRREEIMNERDLLKATSYSNLNKLVQTTKDDDWLCLLMELAEGVDLVSLLKVYKSLSEDLVKLILLQVSIVSILLSLQLSYTLEYLHSNSILYNDMKASHVFITANLRTELIDLGLSEKLEEEKV